MNECFELDVLLVPAPVQLLQPREARSSSLVEGGEARAMDPGGVAGSTELDADHMARGLAQELTIMGDKQHRLRRGSKLLLEPQLPWHI